MLHIKRKELAELISSALKKKYINKAAPNEPNRIVRDISAELDVFEYSINNSGGALDTLDITIFTSDKNKKNKKGESLIIC